MNKILKLAEQLESRVQIEKAKCAKTILKNRFGKADWLCGIGIGGTPGNYCVKVNVSSDEARRYVPDIINDVPVIVMVVGNIIALDHATEVMTVTFHRADLAAGKLDERLGSPSWLQGIGVEPDAVEGWAVTVRIVPDAPMPDIPDRLDGVRVHVVRRARAVPFRPSQI
jgi:hypothetical protein